MSPADRLFVGVYPGGIVYADLGREKHGDYARVAFLPWRELALKVEAGAAPALVALATAHAATITAQRGQLLALSSTAERNPDGSLAGCGQTVRLGG